MFIRGWFTGFHNYLLRTESLGCLGSDVSHVDGDGWDTLEVLESDTWVGDSEETSVDLVLCGVEIGHALSRADVRVGIGNVECRTVVRVVESDGTNCTCEPTEVHVCEVEDHDLSRAN